MNAANLPAMSSDLVLANQSIAEEPTDVNKVTMTSELGLTNPFAFPMLITKSCIAQGIWAPKLFADPSAHLVRVYRESLDSLLARAYPQWYAGPKKEDGVSHQSRSDFIEMAARMFREVGLHFMCELSAGLTVAEYVACEGYALMQKYIVFMRTMEKLRTPAVTEEIKKQQQRHHASYLTGRGSSALYVVDHQGLQAAVQPFALGQAAIGQYGLQPQVVSVGVSSSVPGSTGSFQAYALGASPSVHGVSWSGVRASQCDTARSTTSISGRWSGASTRITSARWPHSSAGPRQTGHSGLYGTSTGGCTTSSGGDKAQEYDHACSD